MKLRTLPVAAAAAVALLIPTSGWTPAFADPAADPVFSSLDSNTAGHLTGTIDSTGVPEIYVRFSNADGVQYRHLTLGGDSGPFDLPTWGYAGTTSIYAIACPVADPTSVDCSPESVVGSFTPTDVTPTVTWSQDTTIGPDDQVTVTDVSDTGGGVLYAQFDNTAPVADPPRFALATSAVATLEDGIGAMVAWRCDDLNTDQCAAFDPASPTYTVKQTATATVGAVTGVSDASPSTTFAVTTTGAGTGDGSYSVDWHLEKAGTPVDGYSATGVTGTLTGGVTADIDLAATGLPDGDYLPKGDYAIVGAITVEDADFGTYTLPMTGGTVHSSGDVTAPVVNAMKVARAKIYPLISDSTFPGSTAIDVTGSGVPEISSIGFYAKSTGKLVRTLKLTLLNPLHGRATWNGRTYAGVAVPSGTYVIKARDAAGNHPSVTAQVTVSGYKLVSKTWSRTFTPVGSLAGSYVAKCSTLRTPSLRGWYHSLGYYANTRCTSQTTANSLIQTAHSAILPKAAEYTSIRVSAYGGAARAKPGSKIRIRYLNTKGDWTNTRTLAATLGNHNGITASASSLVFSDHSFGWGLYTGFGYQYDVKSFTIVLHYKVLG